MKSTTRLSYATDSSKNVAQHICTHNPFVHWTHPSTRSSQFWKRTATGFDEWPAQIRCGKRTCETDKTSNTPHPIGPYQGSCDLHCWCDRCCCKHYEQRTYKGNIRQRSQRQYRDRCWSFLQGVKEEFYRVTRVNCPTSRQQENTNAPYIVTVHTVNQKAKGHHVGVSPIRKTQLTQL